MDMHVHELKQDYFSISLYVHMYVCTISVRVCLYAFEKHSLKISLLYSYYNMSVFSVLFFFSFLSFFSYLLHVGIYKKKKQKRKEKQLHSHVGLWEHTEITGTGTLILFLLIVFSVCVCV